MISLTEEHSEGWWRPRTAKDPQVMRGVLTRLHHFSTRDRRTASVLEPTQWWGA